MLTITVSTGSQTEGLLLNETIVEALMGQLNDAQRVELVVEFMKAQLAITGQSVIGPSLRQAIDYVDRNTTVQT